MIIRFSLAILAALALSGAAAPGQDEASEKPLLLGNVKVYMKAGRIEAPGVIAIDRGVVEYMICSRGGKDYESVVSLDLVPSDLNTALLLIGLKAGGGVDIVGDSRVPAGDGVVIYVEWVDEKTQKKARVRGERMITNVQKKGHMREIAWIYTGGRFARDKETGKDIYLSDVVRVVAATYRDPDALLNNPLETGIDDVFYEADPAVVPHPGTKVTVVFEPASAQETRNSSGKDEDVPPGAKPQG